MEPRVVMEMELLSGLVVFAIGAALGFGVIKLMDRMRKRDAERDGERILAEAELKATGLVREAEHSAKERALQARLEAEKDLTAVRDKLRDRSVAYVFLLQSFRAKNREK